MSLLWIDGFDQYTTVNGTNLLPALSTAGYTEIGVLATASASNNTRTGVGMSLATSYPGSPGRAIPSCVSIITGFAEMHDASNNSQFFAFRYNDFLGNEYDLCHLSYNTNGAITAVISDRGGSNVIASYHSEENVVYPNVWHYIEVLYTPSASGTLIVKVDGIAVITASSVRTVSADLPNTINVLTFRGTYANSGGYWIDDWYVLNNDNSGLSHFLGDVVCHAIFPVDDAAPNQMSQFGGAVGHFSTLNDPGVGDDVAYVYTAVAGAEERFDLAPLPLDIIDVLAVSVSVRAKKDSAGQSNYRIRAVSGASVSESGDLVTTTQYITKVLNVETPPGGGSWTTNKAQNLQIGFRTV